MDVAITGSHGLIGTALTRSLEADGHTVRPIVRSGGGPGAIAWDIGAGTMDQAALDGVEAVVHLAGEGVASGRWTDEHKRRVRDSRTQGTALLAGTLAKLGDPPSVLISGSAIGIYGGDRGGELLTEQSALGDDFLAKVCIDWEAATAVVDATPTRVAHIRTGIVLSADGGALGKQLLPYKLGLGGRAGKGDQWLSWISLDDEVRAIRHLLDHDVSGPVNLTAPDPVTSAAFASTLGTALHRPAVIPIPHLVSKLPFGIGELAESLLFASQRVQPAVLEASGFEFHHPVLPGALEAIL